MKRLLITGSRHWTNREVVYMALARINQQWNTQLHFKNVLIQGECPYGGADLIAKEIWQYWGLKTEDYPAEVVNGKLLGPQRNAKMVNSGASMCIGFPLEGSRGTYNCMNLAVKAGIPTIQMYENGWAKVWNINGI